jgi:hypothetical protein
VSPFASRARPWGRASLRDRSRLAIRQVRGHHQILVIRAPTRQPPQAGRIAPLTGAAASLARKAITAAIASGATAWAVTSAGTWLGSPGVEQLRRDPVHPDPVRAELDLEGTGQVDKGGLARAVGHHAAGWLNPRAGGDVHDDTGAPLPHVRRDRQAQPQRRSQDVDRAPQRLRGRAERVPGRNAPMVFTSTSGPRPRRRSGRRASPPQRGRWGRGLRSWAAVVCGCYRSWVPSRE